MSTRAFRVSPRPALAPYVRHIRVAFPERDARPYVRLPDGELELVIRVGADESAAHAIGTRMLPLHKSGYAPLHAFAVRFKAGGAYPFFGVPVSELTDQVISIDTLWGSAGEALRAALLGETAPLARVAAIEEALSARLSGSNLYEPTSAASVRRALRWLAQVPSLPNVEGLAQQVGASQRQLRRSFAAVTGLGPKECLRVLRFQRALQSARAADVPHWGSIAVQHGYYDQAHLIAEFHALAGGSPGALLGRKARPAPTVAAY